MTPDLLPAMVQAIVDEVDPDQIILFGSQARGEPRARGARYPLTHNVETLLAEAGVGEVSDE